MLANQKFHLLSLFTLINLLFFTNSAIGQGKKYVVEDIKEGNFSHPGSILITLKTNQGSNQISVKKKDSIDSNATITISKQNKNRQLTLYLKTINGNQVIVPPETIVKTEVNKEEEKYDLLKIPDNKKLRINKLDSYLGNVLLFGMRDRIEALTVGTEFSLGLKDNDLEFELFHGKLLINRLIKREIKDDNVIDNNGKRSLFIRENRELTVKDKVYPRLDDNFDSLPELTNDKEIKKYLRKPVISQRKVLLNKGEFSKKAVKEMENDASYEEALLFFDKALDNGELAIEFIIQSALLFSDNYLFNGNKEKSRNWLEVGIYFRDKWFENKQRLLNSSSDNDKPKEIDMEKILINDLKKLSENALNNVNSDEIDLEIVLLKELMYEMQTANEFSAWAYDIKLKLNGCLENPSENPLKYRSNAVELLKAIEKDK